VFAVEDDTDACVITSNANQFKDMLFRQRRRPVRARAPRSRLSLSGKIRRRVEVADAALTSTKM
jgi:hypothetical protein